VGDPSNGKAKIWDGGLNFAEGKVAMATKQKQADRPG
jgi:hypothetical protein